MKPPAPPRVADRYRYWRDAPPELSDRCKFWIGRIENGWRPGRHVGSYGYDEMALYLGVYIYEYMHVLSPLLQRPASQRQSDPQREGNGT